MLGRVSKYNECQPKRSESMSNIKGKILEMKSEKTVLNGKIGEDKESPNHRNRI